MEGAAVVEVVTPATATGAERHTNVRGRLTEEANHPANIERTVDKSFHPGSLLRIPDIKEDSTRARNMEIANDPRWSSKTDVVLEDSGEKDVFSSCQSEVSVLRCDEGDANKFAERSGERDLTVNCGTLGDNATHEGFNPSNLRRGRNT